MAFQKGQSGNPSGRPPGSANKYSTDIKKCLHEALELAGDAVGAASGQKGSTGYLVWLGINHPATFGSLIGKSIPATLAGDADNPLEVIHKIERLIVDAAITDS